MTPVPFGGNTHANLHNCTDCQRPHTHTSLTPNAGAANQLTSGKCMSVKAASSCEEAWTTVSQLPAAKDNVVPEDGKSGDTLDMSAATSDFSRVGLLTGLVFVFARLY